MVFPIIVPDYGNRRGIQTSDCNLTLTRVIVPENFNVYIVDTFFIKSTISLRLSFRDLVFNAVRLITLTTRHGHYDSYIQKGPGNGHLIFKPDYQ
jgi:ABC-type uncharacterized transport system YnjBCD ATPase subunit